MLSGSCIATVLMQFSHTIACVQILRKMLDEYGFENTKIVAADGSFAGSFAGISSAILSDKELADA